MKYPPDADGNRHCHPTATATATPPAGQQRVAKPTFNPLGGSSISQTARTVTISAAAGSTIYYTKNGTVPTPSNGTPLAPGGTASVIPTYDGTSLQAIACKAGMIDSQVGVATFFYTGGAGGGKPNPAGTTSSTSMMPPGGGGPELPPEEDAATASPTVPSYDANGNLKTYDGWTYTYDAQNRLTSANGNGHSATFCYDGKNRQIARWIDGSIRYSVWDDWELIEEYADSSSRSAAYLQGAHGVIRALVSGSYYYYYQDTLGSTTHLANAAGQLLESYRYDLYGTSSYFNSTAQPLNSSTYGIVDLYAGERWVSDLGLYDLRNRFMSPELGRFIQADPIGFKGDANNLYVTAAMTPWISVIQRVCSQ
jgi:RHS repeat-associated protein